MLNLRNVYPLSSISLEHRLSSTKNSQDTCSSKRPQTATYSAITAPAKKSETTWTSTCSEPLLTRQHIMDLVLSVSISSGNLYSILNSSKLSSTSRARIKNILSCLRQTVRCLNELLINYSVRELTRFSGAGDRNLNGQNLQSKNLKTGKRSPSESSKKSRRKTRKRSS